MNILIKRYRIRPETIDGHLYINGSTKICDTAENALHALPAGEYRIHVCKCKQYARKKPLILPLADEGSKVQEFNSSSHPDGKIELLNQPKAIELLNCANCKKQPYTGNNTNLSVFCPQLSCGNGVYNRNDGAILLGEYIAPGCLKHPKENFDRVYEMIRKASERGHPITLTIV